jgi:hypothetical protein
MVFVLCVKTAAYWSALRETRSFKNSCFNEFEAEGISALVTLQFYIHPGSTEAGAILTFSDRDRIMEHIAMITKWEEFKRFFATAKPLDVRVYGKLTSDADAWVRQLDVVSTTFEEHVAGFVR